MDWGAFESLSINYEEGYKEGISLTDKSLHKSISKFLDEGELTLS